MSCRVRYPESQPGDDVCRNPDVGALTASIMTGLATLDGVTCQYSRTVGNRLTRSISFFFGGADTRRQVWKEACHVYSAALGNGIHGIDDASM